MSTLTDARLSALAACEDLCRAVLAASPQRMDDAAVVAKLAAENLAGLIREQPHTYVGAGR
jgi:hypothetical protein